MMEYKEELLKQLCSRLDKLKTQSYSHASEVRQSELSTIITIVKTLNIPCVVGRSEQLPLNKTFYKMANKLDYAEFCKWINSVLR